MDNTPDYENDLAFAPGDWSDSRVTNTTDRTESTIKLIEKIEQLEKENKQLRKWCEEFNALIVAEENQKLSHQNEYLNSAYIAECNRADELEDSLQKSWRNEGKLKELLKECRKSFCKLKGDTVWYPYEVDECIAKIDEVLK